MFPLLFKIGPIPIHTYGFMIAIGFLASIWHIRRTTGRAGLDVERCVDFGFWALFLGFVGARTLFIITRLSYFMADPIAIFKIWEGGLVFFGGPLAVVPFAFWYFKKYKLPPWKTSDALIGALPLGHMFGRFGCLAAGCCYGRPTGSDWGIRLFSELVDRDHQGIPLHPTQLYEASALFLLYLGMAYVQKHKKFDGQVVLTYFMAYPIIRSIVEIYRGDLIRGFVIDGVLSTSQFISLLVFAGAAAFLVYRLRQVRGQPVKR